MTGTLGGLALTHFAEGESWQGLERPPKAMGVRWGGLEQGLRSQREHTGVQGESDQGLPLGGSSSPESRENAWVS